MFRPLTLWQNIPCPALDARGSCTVTHCLFSHALSRPTAPPPPAASPPPPQPPADPNSATRTPPPPAALSGDPRLRKIIEANTNPNPNPNPADSDDRRDYKRRRVLDDTAAPPGPDSAANTADSTQPPAVKRTKTKVETAGSALGAPRSILKKSPPAASASASASAAVPKTTNGTSAGKGAPAKTTQPAKSEADAKPLSLNPRLVPSSPATHAVRLQLLTLLHAEYVRLHAGSGDADVDAGADAQMLLGLALDEEERVAREMRSIYTQAMKKRIVKLKNSSAGEFAAEQEKKRQRAAARKEEEEEEKERAKGVKAAAAGGKVVDHGMDNGKPPLETGLTPAEELQALAGLLQEPAQLKGYKYVLEPPTAGEVEAALRGAEAAGGWEACDRCGSRFQVFDGRRESDGQLASGGKCTYHWGRAAWPSRSSANRAPTDSDKIFTCCRQRVGQSAGCTTCDNHVYKISESKRLASLWQFIKTPPRPQSSPQSSNAKEPIERALCLDCEMCYTTHGMELIRLTATAFPSGATVIDALVRPAGGILDLNSRYSGVFPSQLMAATPHVRLPYPPTPTSHTAYINPTATAAAAAAAGVEAPPLQILPSPQAARELLLSYVDAETPLLGHALENDLGVLRLCHGAVVDTAVLFPHARGLPMRNKLKYLVERYLERRIQVEEDEARGHDSAVDARCAGELVRWRVREGVVLERGRREGGMGVGGMGVGLAVGKKEGVGKKGGGGKDGGGEAGGG
ncbi:uncharacterized protein H6S33_009206 [Morchella sextelata]|uniref:uncharacterized protein n=1 Tax=Morchella sextelata TaxID=1174677 RepID=UPI001D059C8E|nr:uncharacterized protein H6S33_009206 [Morchella sextelata]KAH0612826.1 hypothetical protein H6S33_009206 [Morchella sextelata]